MSTKQQVAKWKKNARVNIDAAVAEKALEAIRRKCGGEGLTPAAIVNAARNPTHPLHKEFIWDDKVAAEGQRVERARYLVRSLEITVVKTIDKETTTITVRKYASVGGGGGYGKDSTYQQTRDVLSDAEMYREVLLKVWHQLLALKRQYADYKELAYVWEALDAAQDSVAAAS